MNNEIYRERVKNFHYAGTVVDVAESGLDRAEKLLAGINGGVYKAVGSALARAAASAKTVAKSEAAKEYSISPGEFLQNTKNINHFTRESDGGISVVFGFAGYVIPLTKFNTRIDNDGRVITQVKRSGAAEILNRAFAAQMGPHRGIYEREGAGRFPVKELYGPATPQMMNSQETVMDAIEDKLVESYQQRLEHEILRIMNGWGK